MKKSRIKSGANAPVAKNKLKRLLRALARDQALLMREEREAGDENLFGLYVGEEGKRQLVFRPDCTLVEHCLGEDLLLKTPDGWVIGDNGLQALKRLLASFDPFIEQHQCRTIEQRNVNDVNQQVMINDRASPLGWLARRKDASGQPMISKAQFAAGERLAQDFQFAGMMPRITSSWSGLDSRGQQRSAALSGVMMSDNALAAKQRVRGAINEAGSDLADILLDICCFQIGLSQAEKTRGWPRRSGKIILRIALDRLADHYGMSSKNNRQRRDTSISHWGAEDYKPL